MTFEQKFITFMALTAFSFGTVATSVLQRTHETKLLL